MQFEWDERKNQSNLIKHGFDFADAYHIFSLPGERNFVWGEFIIDEAMTFTFALCPLPFAQCIKLYFPRIFSFTLY